MPVATPKRTLALAFIVLLSCASVAYSQPKPNQIFQPIVPVVTKQTQVPVLLPAHVPSFDATGKAKVYADLKTATPFEYIIVLGYDPKCIEATPCRLGFISGKVKTPITLLLEEEYEYDSSYRPLRSPDQPDFISLANKTKAYFLPYSCFNACSDSVLAWDLDGYRYVISIRSARKEELLNMANSMFNKLSQEY